MLKEFKEFAMRGSVLDLAVGVILGAAFGKVVSSFVDDVLMPPLGHLIGKVDFSNRYINLTGTHYDRWADAKAAGAALSYGNFINNIINFLIVAFAIFVLVRSVNKWLPKPPSAGHDQGLPAVCYAHSTGGKEVWSLHQRGVSEQSTEQGI